MFTGLVEKTGVVGRITNRGKGAVIAITVSDPWPESDPIVQGESICVQGACLTVTESSRGGFMCDVLEETLGRTTIGSACPGTILNLERAMKSGSRFGGHIVSGHVDCTGRVASVKLSGTDRVVEIACGKPFMNNVVEKGSVACDGVSLTVAGINDESFTVCIIPETWRKTSLSSLKTGKYVNLESDLIGKYILKHMENSTRDRAGVTIESLKEAGFL